MNCQIRKMRDRNLFIRNFDNNISSKWCLLDIPEEIYEEIKKKLHGKPYTGIHKEIFDLIVPRRNQYQDLDAILDYLYCNGFDYLFEE